MASAIDATKPVAGNPTTESVRANFAAAKSEIELLQQTAGVGPQGPIGPTGPSGTLTVGTVTTGPAGGSAAVTNTGTTQAAVLNFTLPRGDSGTGGSGITETQAKDAVRQGNVTFLESPETTSPTFPTTNAASAPTTVGAGWTPQTGGTATQAYTHEAGSGAGVLAYPATISNGTFYQVVFTMSNVAATSTVTANFFTIYFRTAPTTTTGQQIVLSNVMEATTVTLAATANFSFVVVVPVSGWQGNFTLTRLSAASSTENSVAFSIKDWSVKARDTSLYIGGGGRFATNTNNISLGRNALNVLTNATDDIAIGANASSKLSTGNGNIAVGRDAMQNLTTGAWNVAVGYQAMQNAISGSYNTGIGYYALRDLKTGSYNTACGYMAGFVTNSDGSGRYNTSLGTYTNFYNVGASSFNVAVGDWVGFDGSNNVGVGFQALAFNPGPPGQLGGSNNVAVGYMAASRIIGGSSSVTKANNSVFVGANIKAAADDQHNQIVIGYNAEGHGSNTITLGNDAITALHCHVQTISALSDSRVKENIQPTDLNKCLTAVKNLPVSEWDWLPIAGAHRNKHDIGFVSDDVAKVFPQAITKEDRCLMVRDMEGKPEMTTVTDPGWTPPANGDGVTPAAIPPSTRQIEKTMEIKGLQYVSTAEMLPTLWGAVQKLIQQVEELNKKS